MKRFIALIIAAVISAVYLPAAAAENTYDGIEFDDKTVIVSIKQNANTFRTFSAEPSLEELGIKSADMIFDYSEGEFTTFSAGAKSGIFELALM